MPAPQFEARTSFTVGAVAGVYATEEIVFAGGVALGSSLGAQSPGLTAVTALVESLGLAVDAVVELWLLKVGGTPGTAGHWFYAQESLTAGAETWPLASYRGAKIRVKSGGTAGTVIINATAD